MTTISPTVSPQLVAVTGAFATPFTSETSPPGLTPAPIIWPLLPIPLGDVHEVFTETGDVFGANNDDAVLDTDDFRSWVGLLTPPPWGAPWPTMETEVAAR